ncbi:hypothetical protein IWW45_003356 [Coemansia sp. RSA 485]|nr:hypothetical protein IWW45_003356 [Coemansia sp. RSA 485]
MSQSTPLTKKRKTESKPAVPSDLPDTISYKALAEKFPELTPFLVPMQSSERRPWCSIDFKDPLAVRALNRALLKVYFGLDVTLPRDSLCPKVANRLNYLRWIKHNISCDFPLEPLKGLDIGTGSSCIYPLLGARFLECCSFVATEINAESVRIAIANVAQNDLVDKIHVYQNPNRELKLPLDCADFPGRSFTFSMCNPPFYANEEERTALRESKADSPSLNTLAKADELYTEGGEEQFLSDMADESKILAERIVWYTTMVGRKRTLGVLKAKLASLGAKQIREGTLVQGKTSRWVLGWSFVDKRVFSFNVGGMDRSRAWLWFKDVVDELGIAVEKTNDEYWKCSAAAMSWTRRARRQKNRDPASRLDPDLTKPPMLTFLVSIVEQDGHRDDGSSTSVPSAISTINMFLTSENEIRGALCSLYNFLLRKQRDDGLNTL